MACACVGELTSRSTPSFKVGSANHCKSSQAQARPGGKSKLDPGHGQLKGSASTDANASAYFKPAVDHATGVAQLIHATQGMSNDSSAVACGHAQAARNGGAAGGFEQCSALIKVSISINFRRVIPV